MAGSSTRGPTPCNVAGSKIGVHHPLVHESLNLVKHGLASLSIAFLRLRPEKVVDVWIPAISVGGAADDEGLDA